MFRTSDVMAITKWSIPVEAISASLGMSQAFATSSPPSRSAGALLHPAENISSALKRGVNICQRQFVNEVLGTLVAQVVRNLGGEDAKPIQHAFPTAAFWIITSRLVKLIRHSAPPKASGAALHEIN